MTRIPSNSRGRSFRARRKSTSLSANFTREFPPYSITVSEIEDRVAMSRTIGRHRHRHHRAASLAAFALVLCCRAPDFVRQPASRGDQALDRRQRQWHLLQSLFYEEFEDPDVIRVGEDYYLAGTTMHMNPAVQLMHSKDLVNWELVGYCMDRLDLGPAFRLEDGGIYGRGIWAPCIRYHNGMFYIFSNVNGVGFQVFRSKSIHGPWERNQLPGRHDLSVLFDDDLGKIYIISGGGSPYPIEEMAPDLRSFVTDAPERPTRWPQDGRRPPSLQDQRQVFRHVCHSRRSGRSDGRQG